MSLRQQRSSEPLLLLRGVYQGPKPAPANREVGAGKGRQSLLVTNFDNAFVSGSKVKYGHSNPLLPELKHKGDFSVA